MPASWNRSWLPEKLGVDYPMRSVKGVSLCGTTPLKPRDEGADENQMIWRRPA